MIRWQNQVVETVTQALADVLPRLPIATARRLKEHRQGAPLVIVDAGVRARVAQHLAASRYEQGGLLLGEVYAADPARAEATKLLVRVSCAVAGIDHVASEIALRMASSVWQRARPLLDEGRAVVGWYHSHPGLGAFFSDADRRTQRSFFPHAYSLGWVIDPLSGAEKWFCGAAAVQLAADCVLGV